MALKERNGLDTHPELRKFAELAGAEALQVIRLITVRPGKPVFRDGEPCEHYLLMLEGSARVQKLSESGQIITLYHLAAGDACELTTSCLLAERSYPAEAVAETEVRAALLPKVHFQEALARSPQFRSAVFSTIDKGMQDLVTLVEEVSFGPMDRRLARCLLQSARDSNRLQMTHHSLAEELGTAREVVSRQLKEFEHRGWVRLHRGWIEITDRNALHQISHRSAV